MTTTSVDDLPQEAESEITANWYRTRALPLVGCFAIAGALAAYAEYRAALGATSIQYVIFWVAYAFILLPTTWIIVSRRTPHVALPSIVVGLGVWGVVPKLLRTGYQILYFDEFDHFRILQGLAQTGHLQSDGGLLQIGASFPGIELFTSAAARVSGLSLVGAALSVTVIVHVATLVGMYTLVRNISSSPRAGALAALIYSLNPSWLFFDVQFSYEGFGIAILVWTLVYAQKAVAAKHLESRTWLTAVLAMFLTVCLITIHHVTSIALAAFLCLWAIVAGWRVRRGTTTSVEQARLTLIFAAVAVVTTAWRLTTVGQKLFSYLAPSFRISNMFSALLGFFGLGSGQVTRATLTGGLPFYEIACAYAMIPILLIAFVWSLIGLWQKRQHRPTIMFVLAIFGLAFFASLPLVTVRQFSESVHRSWAFSFIGLAALISIAIVEHQRGEFSISFRHRVRWPSARISAKPLIAAGLASVLIIAVGGVATGTDKYYRFGSPVVPGADAVAYGTQTVMVSNWFAHHTSSKDVLFADRYVGHAIAIASPIQVPYQEYLLQLVFASDLQASEVKIVQDLNVNYIVIDRRMATVVPATGFWYGYSEPNAYTTKLVPYNNIERFGCLDWLNAVFATTDYEVFHVNKQLLASHINGGSTGITPACALAGVH